jgi:tRNA pseudouridine38-40 synthase
MRYFLYLAYHGSNYHGWQKQPNALGVQQVLEDKISIVLQQPIELVGSGRTDTGVHASEQVAHFDVENALDEQQFIYKLNKLLPADIAAYELRAVADVAHARFDAIARSYEYRINRTKNPFIQGLSYHYTLELHIQMMNEAAAKLKLHKDFESFSRVKTDVHTFNCDIFEAVWEEAGDFLIFHVTANRFLRGMVRALVGTLLEVGSDKMSPDEFEKIIVAKDRQKAGRAVPPQGLFLTKVDYPEELFID